MNRLPIPGQVKIVSVTIAPENRNGISRATLVTTGSIALRKACLPMTTRSRQALGLGRPDVVLVERLEHRRPDEPAVPGDVHRHQGQDRQDQVPPDVGDRRDRVRRRTPSQYWGVPNGGQSRVVMIPPVGNQWSATPKMKIMFSPSQNVGSE